MLPWQLPAHEDKGYTSSRARRRSEAMRADTQTPARQLRVCQSTSQNYDFRTVARVCAKHFSLYQQSIFLMCSISKHRRLLMLAKVL